MKAGPPLAPVGAYFFSAPLHLYLIASPEDSANLRLSVYDATPGSAKHAIIRGVVLGVHPNNVIISSRCVLVPMALASENNQDRLWMTPTSRQDFDKLNSTFQEVARFLFGEEDIDYIKLLKLPPRGD